MIIINSLLPAPVQKSSTVNNANHKNNYAPVAKGINIIKAAIARCARYVSRKENRRMDYCLY